jgi:hypothetical protein
LTELRTRATRHDDWRAWLEPRLPAPLRSHITGVIERAGELVIFTDSSSWSARVRYALADLDGELRAERPAIARIVVRVLPRG